MVQYTPAVDAAIHAPRCPTSSANPYSWRQLNLHLVRQPSCQAAILSGSHLVRQPSCQAAILSGSHLVRQPSCQAAILSGSQNNAAFLAKFNVLPSTVKVSQTAAGTEKGKVNTWSRCRKLWEGEWHLVSWLSSHLAPPPPPPL